MCLFACFQTHPTMRPLIAERPLIVWKALYENETVLGKVYASPYQSFHWFMGVLETAAMTEHAVNGVVSLGFHAIVAPSPRSARAKVERMGLDTGRYSGLVILPAVIPTGARFYIGRGSDNDVAANHMVVYQSMAALKKAYGGREFGAPITRTSLRQKNA